MQHFKRSKYEITTVDKNDIQQIVPQKPNIKNLRSRSKFIMNNTETMKKEVSTILIEKRDWKEFSEVKPNKGELVVIRMTDPDQICYEDDTSIYRLEDIMIASWNGDYWRVDPPFHKYNYSPLTNRCKILPNAVVTHWAIPAEGEVEAWHNRLSYFHEYNNLSITVDPGREEAVYKALLWGAAFIEEIATSTEDETRRKELEECYKTLKDLQYSIDHTASTEVSGD